MRILLTTFTLLAFVINSFGQSISGNLINESQEEVAFATVALLNANDSSMVKAMVSNDKGQFAFANVKAGRYQIQSSFVGYEQFNSDPFVHDGMSNLQLEAFTVKESARQLENVVVQSSRPLIEVQPDKTVFNVEGSINAKGNTALELLRKSPGVMVDNNDNLMLQGKNGVQVYIDGKRSPLSGDDLAIFLKNLQSDQVDAIEVITNPSAKYDAQGNAGIINIRLIKDKSLGTNGSVNTGYRYGLNPKYSGSLNLNHRNQAFNSFGSYSLFNGDFENDFWLTRELNGIRYRQVNDILHQNTSQGFRFGTDFFLGQKMTLGFLVNGNVSDQQNMGHAFTEIEEIEDSVIDSLLVASNDNSGSRNNLNFNVNFEWRGEKGQSLTVDLDHGRFRNRTTTYQPNRYLTPDMNTVLQERIFSNVTPTDIDIYTAKIDYETKFMEGQLGMGLKSTNIRTDNTFSNYDIIDGTPQLNEDRSNNFVYDERVNAAYVSWQKSLGEDWNFSAGLRVENTFSHGKLTSTQVLDDVNVKRSYTDYFPSGGLTYKLNEKHNFRLNYSRRVDRPNYQTLNPFEFKLDELSFEKGNPFINPQYSNSYGLTHTFGGTLSTTLNYTVIQDVSTRITEALDEQSAILTYVNLAQQTNLALTVSYPFSIAKWWNVYATVTGYRLHNEANIEGDVIDLTTLAMNFYGQNTFSLPKDFKLEVSGWYNSPAIWAGNWTTNEQFDVSAGISKQLFNDRGSLKVSVSDIFFKNGWGGESSFGELYMTGGGTWESRQVRVNFSYSFGNDQVKGARRRKTGMEEESQRVGG